MPVSMIKKTEISSTIPNMTIQQNGLKQTINNEVVISGVAGRFQELNGVEQLAQFLLNGVECKQVTGEKKFDAEFFGIDSGIAMDMSVRAKCLIESTYGAVVDSGLTMSELKGSNTGVFLGISQLTECHKVREQLGEVVTKVFNLKGGMKLFENQLSSSLIAFNAAVSAIESGHCDQALVCGVEINGDLVDSLTVGCVFLQRRDLNKKFYAQVLNSNVVALNGQNINLMGKDVNTSSLREIYAERNIDPSLVTYIENCGTQSFCEEEMKMLAKIFTPRGVTRTLPVFIGSTQKKTVDEQQLLSTGILSLIKMVITIQQGVIPRSLFVQESSVYDKDFKAVKTNSKFYGGLMALNSLGLHGLNVHIVLQPNMELTNMVNGNMINGNMINGNMVNGNMVNGNMINGNMINGNLIKSVNMENLIQSVEDIKQVTGMPRMFTFSAKTQQGLERIIEEIKRNPIDMATQLQTVVPTVNEPFRGFFILNGQQQIERIQQTENTPKRPVYFVFSGINSDWSGLCAEMMQLETFKKSIMRSVDILKPYGLEINSWSSLIAIPIIQVALVDCLREAGVVADGMIGHSIGELACAYADNCLTQEEVITVAYQRNKVIEEAKLPEGVMAQVGLTWEQIGHRCPSGVVPAIHNHEENVIISGPKMIVQQFIEQLVEEGIFAREIESNNVAFHSYFMTSVAPSMKKSLEKVIQTPKERSSKWISTSIPEKRWSSELAKKASADYFVNNLCSHVLFKEALEFIPTNAMVVEVGPNSILQTILKKTLSTKTIQLPLMTSQGNQLVHFWNQLGLLFIDGQEVKPINLTGGKYMPVRLNTEITQQQQKIEFLSFMELFKNEKFFKIQTLLTNVQMTTQQKSIWEHLEVTMRQNLKTLGLTQLVQLLDLIETFHVTMPVCEQNTQLMRLFIELKNIIQEVVVFHKNPTMKVSIEFLEQFRNQVEQSEQKHKSVMQKLIVEPTMETMVGQGQKCQLKQHIDITHQLKQMKLNNQTPVEGQWRQVEIMKFFQTYLLEKLNQFKTLFGQEQMTMTMTIQQRTIWEHLETLMRQTTEFTLVQLHQLLELVERLDVLSLRQNVQQTRLIQNLMEIINEFILFQKNPHMNFSPEQFKKQMEQKYLSTVAQKMTGSQHQTCQHLTCQHQKCQFQRGEQLESIQQLVKGEWRQQKDVKSVEFIQHMQQCLLEKFVQLQTLFRQEVMTSQQRLFLEQLETLMRPTTQFTLTQLHQQLELLERFDVYTPRQTIQQTKLIQDLIEIIQQQIRHYKTLNNTMVQQWTHTVEPKQWTHTVEPKQWTQTVEPKQWTHTVEPKQWTQTVEPKQWTQTVESELKQWKQPVVGTMTHIHKVLLEELNRFQTLFGIEIMNMTVQQRSIWESLETLVRQTKQITGFTLVQLNQLLELVERFDIHTTRQTVQQIRMIQGLVEIINLYINHLKQWGQTMEPKHLIQIGESEMRQSIVGTITHVQQVLLEELNRFQTLFGIEIMNMTVQQRSIWESLETLMKQTTEFTLVQLNQLLELVERFDLHTTRQTVQQIRMIQGLVEIIQQNIRVLKNTTLEVVEPEMTEKLIKQILKADIFMNLFNQGKWTSLDNNEWTTTVTKSWWNTPSTTSTTTINTRRGLNQKFLMPTTTIEKLNHVELIGQQIPVFIIHSIEGHVNMLRNVSKYVKYPVYGIQYTKEAMQCETIEQLARFYWDQIKKQTGFTRVHLVGDGFGALVAMRMASLKTECVTSLSLLDGGRLCLDRSEFMVKSTDNIEIEALMTFVQKYLQTVNKFELMNQLMRLTTLEERIRFVVNELMENSQFNFELFDLREAARSFVTRWTMLERFQTKFDLKLKEILLVKPVKLETELETLLAETFRGKLTMDVIECDQRSFLEGSNGMNVAEFLNENLIRFA